MSLHASLNIVFHFSLFAITLALIAIQATLFYCFFILLRINPFAVVTLQAKYSVLHKFRLVLFIIRNLFFIKMFDNIYIIDINQEIGLCFLFEVIVYG